jgi:peptide/nickel transport system substrate-binding protein
MGFKPADDGILQRQPSPVLPPIRLTLSIIANEENPQTTAIAEALHIALTSEGVASALQILEPSEFQNRLASGDFDIVVGRITLQNPINMDFLRYGHPSSVFNYNSKVLNGILDEIKSAPNPSALQESTANAQNYIAQNLPIIGIAFHDKFIYTSGRVHGNAQNWFVEP